jgi:hypothetical protein
MIEDMPHHTAKSLLGKRIEIPVHYDMWMRGARYGKVTSIAADGSHILVQLDALPSTHKRLRVHRIDFDYCRTIAPAITVAPIGPAR